MSLRLAALLAAAVTLAGCTDADWDRTMSFAGFDDAPAAPAVPARAMPVAPRALAAAAPAQPAGPDPFCQGVATHDSTSNGFDAATQTQVFGRSYAQCLAVFGPGR